MFFDGSEVIATLERAERAERAERDQAAAKRLAEEAVGLKERYNALVETFRKEKNKCKGLLKRAEEAEDALGVMEVKCRTLETRATTAESRATAAERRATAAEALENHYLEMLELVYARNRQIERAAEDARKSATLAREEADAAREEAKKRVLEAEDDVRVMKTSVANKAKDDCFAKRYLEYSPNETTSQQCLSGLPNKRVRNEQPEEITEN
jgi:hypothetical protein